MSSILKQKLVALPSLVARMRNSQKNYFRAKHGPNKQAYLKESIALEQRVDKELKTLFELTNHLNRMKQDRRRGLSQYGQDKIENSKKK